MGPSGGFSGGPFQLDHLLTTFAAVHAMACIEDYTLIDQSRLRLYLMSLKLENGSFQVHEDGEHDLR